MYGRWRTAAVLAVVLIGLIGLNSVLQARRVPSPISVTASEPTSGTVTPATVNPANAVPASGELFPAVNPDTIDRISAGQPPVTYRKNAGNWQAVDATGTSIPVDPANMVRAITILSTLRYTLRLEDVNVAQFGLNGQAQHEIDFTASGSAHRLRIGNSDQFSGNGSFYMQRDDDPAVYVVTSNEAALLYTSLVVATPTPSASVDAASGTSVVGTATP